MLLMPLQPGVGHYAFRVALDGAEFELELRWNSRASTWMLTIADGAGATLVAGRRVALGTPLTARFRDGRLPAGELLAIDTSGTRGEPELEDLGTRVLLAYVPAAELPSGLVVRT